MADLTAVYAALKAADAAGNTDDARKLADYIRAQSASAAQSTPQQEAPAQPTAPSYRDRVTQTGNAFDKAAGTGLGGIGRTALAAGENALSLFSSIPADIAGAATSAITQNPQKGAALRSALTYEPKTEAGKAGQSYIGALTAPIGNLLNKPVQALEQSGHPILAQATRAAEDVAPFALPKALGKLSNAIPVNRAPLTPEVQEATQAGLRLTPQQAGGAVGQTLQSLTGSAKLERSISLKNAPQVNKLGAQELGISDLSDTALGKAKTAANAVYDKADTAGTVQLNPADFQTVRAPGTLQDPAIEALRDHYTQMGSVDAKDLLADMRQLRRHASGNIKSPDPAKSDLGWAQKAAADALEGSLDRHLQGLGNQAPVSITDFQNARTQLAKIHSVEDAMDGRNLSAKELAKQINRGVPLSGNLRVIANAYNNFDRSLQESSRIRDSGPFGALDTPILALGGLKHPGVIAATLAKPLVRSALASKPYQAIGIGGAPLVSPAVRGLLGAGGQLNPALLGFGANASLMNEQPQGLLSGAR